MKKFVLILLALIAFAKLTNAQVSTIFGYDKEIVLPAMNELDLSEPTLTDFML